jgi:hypothetical protein
MRNRSQQSSLAEVCLHPKYKARLGVRQSGGQDLPGANSRQATPLWTPLSWSDEMRGGVEEL